MLACMFVWMLDVTWMNFGEWRLVVVCWLKIITYFHVSLGDFDGFGDFTFPTLLLLGSGSRTSSTYGVSEYFQSYTSSTTMLLSFFVSVPGSGMA